MLVYQRGTRYHIRNVDVSFSVLVRPKKGEISHKIPRVVYLHTKQHPGIKLLHPQWWKLVVDWVQISMFFFASSSVLETIHENGWTYGIHQLNIWFILVNDTDSAFATAPRIVVFFCLRGLPSTLSWVTIVTLVEATSAAWAALETVSIRKSLGTSRDVLCFVSHLVFQDARVRYVVPGTWVFTPKWF